MKPKQIAQIGYWLNEIEHKSVAQAIYDRANEALAFFGPEVAWRLDLFEMRQTCMRKLQ